MGDLLIQARKITKTYTLPAEEIFAVREVNLDVTPGEFVAIMGPSGSGKTTLLDILGCLDRITSGQLQVLGQDVSQIKESELVKIRRGNIGFVFQDFLLVSTLTAAENVELPLSFLNRGAGRDQAVALLKRVGLGHRSNHLPKQLSGGERQRVAIARALVTAPKLLFADEPTGNLDTHSGQQIIDILKELNQKDGVTILLTTHNSKLGAQASRIVYLKDGQIVSQQEANG